MVELKDGPGLDDTFKSLFAVLTEEMAVMQKPRLTQVLILLACGIGIGFTLRTIARRYVPVDAAIAEPSSEKRTQGLDALHKEKSEPFAGTIEEQSPIEPARIFVVGLVQNCARYEVRPEDTFGRILARAGGEALESTDNEPQRPRIWPALYVRISLKTAVDGKRTLSVPKRLWNEAVSKDAPLNNIIGIQFVAAY